ncbi:MAG: hypothetical protein FJY66_00015 [Calditrichaeota bacterium]|nr:hypothetical protein [Calditrichota bacterium]
MTKAEQEALEGAWKRETRSENEYRRRAAATRNPLGKATFLTIALRQREYLATIQKVHAALESDKGDSTPKIRFPVFAPVLLVTQQILRKKRPTQNSDIESMSGPPFRSYLWALRLEEKSWAIYAHEVTKPHHKLLKKLFRFLQKQKGENYRILDETLACCHASNPSATEFNRCKPMRRR